MLTCLPKTESVQSITLLIYSYRKLSLRSTLCCHFPKVPLFLCSYVQLWDRHHIVYHSNMYSYKHFSHVVSPCSSSYSNQYTVHRMYVAASDTQVRIDLFHNNIAVSVCKVCFHLSTHGIQWVNLIGPSLPMLVCRVHNPVDSWRHTYIGQYLAIYDNIYYMNTS